MLDDKGAARGTGETYEVPASLVVTAIGYSTSPIADVPFEGGKFVNETRPDRRPALCRRLGAARADRDDRHQPPRRL